MFKILFILSYLCIINAFTRFNLAPRVSKNVYMINNHGMNMPNMKKVAVGGMFAFGLGFTPLIANAGMKGNLETFDAAKYQADKLAKESTNIVSTSIAKPESNSKSIKSPATKMKSTTATATVTTTESSSGVSKTTTTAPKKVENSKKVTPKFKYEEERALYSAKENLSTMKSKLKSLQQSIREANGGINLASRSLKKVNMDIAKLQSKITAAHTTDLKNIYKTDLSALQKEEYELSKTIKSFENSISRDDQTIDSTKVQVSAMEKFIQEKEISVKKKLALEIAKEKERDAKVKAEAKAKADSRRSILMKDRTSKLNDVLKRKTTIEKRQTDVMKKIKTTTTSLNNAEQAFKTTTKAAEEEEKKIERLKKLLDEKKKVVSVVASKKLEQEEDLAKILLEKENVSQLVKEAQEALKVVSK